MPSLAWCFNAVTFLIVVQTCFLPKGLGSSKDDKITSLPGQPPVKFNQYAGYITVDDIQQRALFYYFVEAETDPQTKPLVLWFNGGPGCSSLTGAFYATGPFMAKGGVLIRNNFSWNQEANILFLDTPVGAGFSFSRDKAFYNFTNDEITAQDNLKFLLGWLDIYPEYKNRDIFISGVSYGGHFVPQLANLIMDTRLKSNLKGILIASPLLEFDTNRNSMGDFLWSHGVISDSTYSMLNSVCNVSQIMRQEIDGKNTAACLQVYNQVIEEVGNFVETDNVLTDVGLSESSSQDVCFGFEVTRYLNRKDVQEALHAKLVGVKQWSICIESRDIGYDPKAALVPTIPLLGNLVKDGVRIMIYNGDQDGVIPFMGTRSLIRVLADQLGLNTTGPYRSWLQDKQVGGWTQVYGDILSFATIRGAGHDPTFPRPERAFLLFSTFLQGKPLPLAPAN